MTSLERLAKEKEMREFYAQQDPKFVAVEKQRELAKTFKPVGLTDQQVDDYLLSAEGQKYSAKLIAADPTLTAEALYNRALNQIASGSTVPVTTRMSTPLVKVVPQGAEGISDYSPFFTTMEELKAAARSDKTLADSLGLPVLSENARYSIFEITPLQPTDVFISKVAPTIEFGGNITRTGEAAQYLVPNRNEWSSAKLIGEIDN